MLRTMTQLAQEIRSLTVNIVTLEEKYARAWVDQGRPDKANWVHGLSLSERILDLVCHRIALQKEYDLQASVTNAVCEVTL